VGGFVVCRSGRTLPAKDVGSRKGRTVLALLAVERGRTVPVDGIVEVLWADAPPRRPAANVATLVSRLRAALGTSVVVGGRTGYRLGDQVAVDLHDAYALVREAETRLAGNEPVSALAAAGRAMELLDAGPVLADEPDALWAEPIRAVQGRLLRQARHMAAEAALRVRDPASARLAAEAAVAADPFDEVASRDLMRAHVVGGEPARALAVYERLRSTLAIEFGVDPAPETRELHLAILRVG
jgi:DNA-binding SARP family transcriptional activator